MQSCVTAVDSQLALSIIIATLNHQVTLETTLRTLAAQDLQCKWEVIVVDNGSTDGTQDVLRSLGSELPLVTLTVPTRGKSRALNTALEICRGSLVAFTDDDVLVSSGWGRDLLRASENYPRHTVFCGPIIPRFPPDTPEWLRKHDYANAAFGRFQPPVPEGPLAPPALPYGANFAVRSSRLRDMRFRLDLGPAEEPFMCEDTNFGQRLRNQGEGFVYVPKASITHLIRPDLITMPSLFRRAYYFGRSIVRTSGMMMTAPPEPRTSLPEAQWFEMGCLLNMYYGQAYEWLELGVREKASLMFNLADLLREKDDTRLLAAPLVELLKTKPPAVVAGSAYSRS